MYNLSYELHAVWKLWQEINQCSKWCVWQVRYELSWFTAHAQYVPFMVTRLQWSSFHFFQRQPDSIFPTEILYRIHICTRKLPVVPAKQTLLVPISTVDITADIRGAIFLSNPNCCTWFGNSSKWSHTNHHLKTYLSSSGTRLILSWNHSNHHLELYYSSHRTIVIIICNHTNHHLELWILSAITICLHLGHLQQTTFRCRKKTGVKFRLDAGETNKSVKYYQFVSAE